MLYLVGSGLEGVFTTKGWDALKECDRLYFERYTGIIEDEEVREWEKALERSFEELTREEVESDFLIREAEKGKVALVVQGDPLVATTHISLLLECKKRGISYEVCHNSTIYSVAPARCGLQIYKFGRTTTLVNPRPNYAPSSPFEIIKKNLTYGMHTLILLDTEPQPMDAQSALSLLARYGFEDRVVVLSRVAKSDEKIAFGKVGELMGRDLGRPPFTLIYPAALHPLEEEYLSAIAGI